MPRTIRNQKLDTRSPRSRLTVRREPYWAPMARGCHVGYRRLGSEAGTWIARAYDAETKKRAYLALGAADDTMVADGVGILSFAQAQEKARAWFPRAFADEAAGDDVGSPVTVGDAVRVYLAWLETNRKPSTASRSEVCRKGSH